MVGLPSSGKTTRAREIQKYFTEHEKKEAILISDNEIILQMNINKNTLFLGKKTFKVHTHLSSKLLHCFCYCSGVWTYAVLHYINDVQFYYLGVWSTLSRSK